ncbi:hypothetical protein [Baaleninema sp.]
MKFFPGLMFDINVRCLPSLYTFSSVMTSVETTYLDRAGDR